VIDKTIKKNAPCVFPNEATFLLTNVDLINDFIGSEFAKYNDLVEGMVNKPDG